METFGPKYAPDLPIKTRYGWNFSELENIVCTGDAEGRKRIKEVENLIKSNEEWTKIFLEVEDAHLYFDADEIIYDGEEDKYGRVFAEDEIIDET